MDGPANPTLASRIHSRHLYQAQQVPQQRLPAPDQPQPHDQFLPPGPDAGPRSRESMSRGHRFFHRRAVLDNVEIVTVLATVDEAGNIIAQETLPPVPPPSLPDVIATAAAAIVSAAPVAQPAQLAIPSAAPALPALPALPAVPIPAQPPVPVPAPALPSVAPAVPSSVAAPALPAVPDTALPDTALPVPNPAVAALVPGPALPVVPTLATSSVAVPAPPTLSAAALAAVSVPVVPSVPVPVLPSVPAVPPFPSDLVVPTVPAYPFPSLNYVAQPVVTSASNASPSSIGSTATPSLPSAINSAANSTLSSTPTLLSSSVLASFDSISASSATDLAVSVNAVPTRSPSDSQSLPASTRTSLTQAIISSQSARSIASASSVLTASSVPTTTANYGGWGGNAPGTGGAPAPTTSATSTADADSSPSALETPKVVGSVLGSLAGVALILALILFLLKRHKQKRGGALQLTGDDHHHQEGNRSMTQAPAPSNTLVPIAFLKRFSGMSGKTAETSTSAGERSFQRVSGRKLPSAFSEGMTSDQFSRGGTMSGSSFYQDDHGLYGSTGLSKEMGKEIGESSAPRESGQMSFRPGPARTPIIRHPDDENPFADRHHLSPPHSPVGDLPPRGTLGRSLPSADGSRSSKFTENV